MAGGRPPGEKSFTAMLRLELKQAHAEGGDKLRAVAKALVDKALTGDVPAIREIGDRIDGKVPQAIQGDGEDGALIIQIVKMAAAGATHGDDTSPGK